MLPTFSGQVLYSAVSATILISFSFNRVCWLPRLEIIDCAGAEYLSLFRIRKKVSRVASWHW